MTSGGTQQDDGSRWHSSLWGPLCATLAAVGYTAANCCLRAVAACDPVWVSCIKAVPTALFTGVVIAGGAIAGRRMLPDAQVMKALILAALLGQLGGNVLFQYSLGVVGIGLGVPLCMGTVIIASAVLARVYLHESVTPGAMASILVLVAAIWILSLGAGDAYRSVAQQAPSMWLLIGGVAAACFSGFAYAVLGVAIRFGVTGRASITATTFVVCAVGVLSLGVASGARLGLAGMLQTTPRDWLVMLAAGVFNFVAFIALVRALQVATVVYVNGVNASQVAMAAVAGVMFFQESQTCSLLVGVVLTIIGLMLMPRERQREHDPDYRPQETTRDRAVVNARNLSSNAARSASNHREKSAIACGSSPAGSATSRVEDE